MALAKAEDQPDIGRPRNRWSTRLADAVLSVLLSPSCAACGAPLERPTQGAVCPACWLAIRPLTHPLCDACGDPLPSWRVISLTACICPRCRRTHPRVSRSRAIGEYDGSLRSIVHAFKYDGRRSLALPLAARMRDTGRNVLEGADAIVPVPLHAARRRERGFNQAHDLARHLGLPVVNALRRIRPTAPQVSLAAARRHANVRGAFRATRAAGCLAGTIVVLVDDVSTTGATLEACARVLDEVGAREVRALTAARVVTRSQ
jgi:ComF family protein